MLFLYIFFIKVWKVYLLQIATLQQQTVKKQKKANTMNILQDVKQNEFHQQPRMSKSSSAANNSKKITTSKSNNNYELQMQIGIAYNEVIQLLKENNLNKSIKLPQEGVKSLQKVGLMRNVIDLLIEEIKRIQESDTNRNDRNFKQTNDMDESNIITCVDCQNYENNLQKLENEVRQHIRLQQQLKIYQESMQEKIQELKKEKSSMQKKIQDLKKKVDEQKNSSSNNSDKVHKLQFQNEKLKNQIKQLKNLPLEASKKIKGYETKDRDRNSQRQKQNRIDWVHRMSNVNKKDESTKDKTQTSNHTDRMTNNDRTDRKSVQKRGDSSDRWRMSGAKSTKLMNYNEKIIQQKNKQERKKAIQPKFDYRR